MAKYIKENVSEDVDVVMTDEFKAYPKALHEAGVLAEHKTICHKEGIYVDGDIYTNTVESAFSLLKHGIVGTWHRMSAKHLQAYLNEMCFRFDNRKNPYLFRDTLLRLLKSETSGIQGTHCSVTIAIWFRGYLLHAMPSYMSIRPKALYEQALSAVCFILAGDIPPFDGSKRT